MYKSAETQWDLGLARSNPMDFSSDSGPLSTRTTVGGPALEQELSLSSTQCQTESGGTILLQLLEFKTHLLEAIEELHIRRDAEARFEDQLSKLVLEKQELEWEKESLQQQLETVANQHTESLANVKKQFQAKVRNTEEEKGKYQVSAELKDKEINSLKEELKSLQLLKFNLEKKSNDLEQKLALQSRSKDSHLNQLGEVEKRFNALSRHCVLVKQAHEKLEQNVDEAMRINKKLSSTNEKQEATIVSLKKELEEASKKLIKAKMTSVRLDKTHSPIGKEQHVQQLHQKLNMETEMNKKFREENLTLRAEKQEVMRSLQHNQQLLLNQTQAVSRVEQELQTQREKYKALKQEHEVMREKSKAVEDKVAQLMDNYAASKTNWDKEKAMFLDRLKSEQQDLQAVFPTLVEETRGGDEPIFSSELPSFGSLQHLASSQSKNPDYLEDTGTLTKLVATGASGGQEALNLHDRSIFKQPLNTLSPFTCPLTTTILVSHSGTSHNNSILTKYMSNSHKVPLIITRASDMLNAFSVSGTAASSRRRQQGKWKTMAETSTETVAADTESRTSPSFSSYLVSTSSSVVSTVSWQATPGCSRGLPFAAGLISESDSELSSSQERGDQQSSFRAQISKIEEFLNAERLYLPKRQRTEN
uniref:coiled-coil domain-containing protein 73 isoform X14 n=1 Tax=Monopterus albus TaxID=43700 RepID=UPI0009B3BF81|nr:coiled-coil domain-containing protein 73 isoform X14 [Monopterus albus]